MTFVFSSDRFLALVEPWVRRLAVDMKPLWNKFHRLLEDNVSKLRGGLITRSGQNSRPFVKTRSRRCTSRVGVRIVFVKLCFEQMSRRSWPIGELCEECLSHFLWWIFKSPTIATPDTCVKYSVISEYNVEKPSNAEAPGRYQFASKIVSTPSFRKCQDLSSSGVFAMCTKQLKSFRLSVNIPPRFSPS